MSLPSGPLFTIIPLVTKCAGYCLMLVSRTSWREAQSMKNEDTCKATAQR